MNARNQRVLFALFIKILLKRLEKYEEPTIHVRARNIVAEWSKMSRMGDPKYYPLVDTLEVALRNLVGEVHWRRTHAYMHIYVSQHQNTLFSSDRGFLHRKVGSHAA